MEIEDEHASKRMRLTYQRGADLNVYNKPAQVTIIYVQCSSHTNFVYVYNDW